MIYCILNQQVNDSSLYNYVTTGDWADSDIILLYDCLKIKFIEFKLQYHLSTKSTVLKKRKALQIMYENPAVLGPIKKILIFTPYLGCNSIKGPLLALWVRSLWVCTSTWLVDLESDYTVIVNV